MQKLQTVLKQKKPAAVIAIGGDGTVNLVAQALLRSKKKIPIGILPAGSANALAGELGIPLQTQPALRVLEEKNTTPFDVLEVNGAPCLHLADIGANAEIIRQFHGQSLRGWLGYLWHFWKQYFQHRAKKFEIQMGQETHTTRAHMVIIANGSQYGTGAQINPHGEFHDGKFEVVEVRPFSRWKFPLYFFQALRGGLHRRSFFSVQSGEKVEIQNRASAPLQVDGEPQGRPEKISVEIHKRVLQFLVPKKK